jgi:hypothetical protein
MSAQQVFWHYLALAALLCVQGHALPWFSLQLVLLTVLCVRALLQLAATAVAGGSAHLAASAADSRNSHLSHLCRLCRTVLCLAVFWLPTNGCAYTGPGNTAAGSLLQVFLILTYNQKQQGITPAWAWT